MAKKEPLFPHVPKSKMVQVGGDSPVSGITKEEEQAILAAQDIIRQIQQMRPQLEKIYDKVKYSMPGWEGPRRQAADFVNSAGALEGELTKKIRTLRARR